MTNEQILELASKHLRYFEDGWRGTEWSGTPEHLLEFALAIHEDGYNEGYGEGWREGYNVGVIEYSND
jgi:hypothetical protein